MHFNIVVLYLGTANPFLANDSRMNELRVIVLIEHEHGKNVTVVVRSMWITQRKIVSNILKYNLRK